MANFDFPPNISISVAAKDLINCLLHPEPEKRPDISGIRSHVYFTGESTSTVESSNNTSTSTSTSTASSGLILSIKRAIASILSNYTGRGNNLERTAKLKNSLIICRIESSKCYSLASMS